MGALSGVVRGTAGEPLDNISIEVYDLGRFSVGFSSTGPDGTYQVTGLKMYKVTAGDTLWDLCKNKFDLPYWLLRKYNSEVNFSKLATNQKLTVPIVEAL